MCMYLMIQLFSRYADFGFLYLQVLQLSSEERGVDLKLASARHSYICVQAHRQAHVSSIWIISHLGKW
jgi:hypothetical protein